MNGKIHTGGCQCGAVRYRVTGRLAGAHVCHCRMCQKATGNCFMPLARAQLAEFSFTRGEPAWFWSSGTVRRGFCASCGTPMFFDIPGRDVLSIALGTLDDPAAVPPIFQCGTEARMPWLDGLLALPSDAADDAAWYEEIAASGINQHPDRDTDTWPPAGEERR